MFRILFLENPFNSVLSNTNLFKVQLFKVSLSVNNDSELKAIYWTISDNDPA